MKKIKSNKWEAICVHGSEDLALFKYLYYPKQSTNSMQSLQKFQRVFLFFFTEIENKFHNSCGTTKDHK